jgi:dihydroorotate dehydrogenase (NAD+) catalytic subunit
MGGELPASQTAIEPTKSHSSATASQSNATDVDLSVTLGRLKLRNPVLVASGTFGYAKEMADIVDLRSLGGILPKTITKDPRPGNPPWRTVEVSAGLLNAIGLDNDGIDYFIENHWPYLRGTQADIINFILALPLDPCSDEIFCEDSTLCKELVILLE